ncbi:hypothetical protein N2152v2_002207 [Parachlorella kessleri]
MLERQFALAQLLAERGRPQDALAALEPLLTQQPSHVEALCLKGRCLANNKPLALAAFAGALAVDPSHVPALLGCACIYKDSGLLEDALAALEKAAAALQAPGGAAGAAAADDPLAGELAFSSGSDAATLREEVARALAIVLTDLGTQLKVQGSVTSAPAPTTSSRRWSDMYQRAVAVCPSYAPAHYNLGVAAAERGDTEAALEHYGEAVRLEPRYAEAHCNMGVLYKAQGLLEEAITSYERSLAAAPNLAVVQANLAVALTDLGTHIKLTGKLDEGIRLYERALALKPRHPDALYNLGVAFTEQGEYDKAIFMYETALHVAPTCAEAHNNLGVLHRELGNLERAMLCYQAALDARPNFPQALNNLAVLYTQQGRAQEALNLLQAAVMAAPTYAEAYNNLGVLQRDVGVVPDAIASYEKCLELDPTNRNAGQNRLLGLNYVHHGETELVCAAHADWGREFEARHKPLPPLSPADVDTTEGRPLVVGYISPDLFTHSVSYFAEAPLAHHDPARVRHIVYCCVPKADHKTEKLRREVTAAGGTWRDVTRLTEAELGQLVREDKVDILVELTGHTAHNRLGTMARRPAPIQVTWIGYPNSTGLSRVDYRLTDAICDPEETTQSFTEELVRLPGCFLCYTPADDAPPVAPLPALRNGFITFGSFNALAKQTPEVLRLWARVLLGVPGSRLVLKNKPLACEVVRNHYWRLFEEAGVDRSRVDLLPLAAANRDHLSQYAWMDVGLDPFPYAGTTTTTEALYMGVPVLTMAGKCHAHNVGASLLAALGLGDEWVARSADEYVRKAAELTRDIQRLSELRQGLRQRMLTSRMCDAPAFVRQLEDVYRGLWLRWVEGGTRQGPA